MPTNEATFWTVLPYILIAGYAAYLGIQKLRGNARAAKTLTLSERREEIEEATKASGHIAQGWEQRWRISEAAVMQLERELKQEREIGASLRRKVEIKDEEIERLTRKANQVADDSLTIQARLDDLQREIREITRAK